jgi:hypothetical protein
MRWEERRPLFPSPASDALVDQLHLPFGERQILSCRFLIASVDLRAKRIHLCGDSFVLCIQGVDAAELGERVVLIVVIDPCRGAHGASLLGSFNVLGSILRAHDGSLRYCGGLIQAGTFCWRTHRAYSGFASSCPDGTCRAPANPPPFHRVLCETRRAVHDGETPPLLAQLFDAVTKAQVAWAVGRISRPASP